LKAESVIDCEPELKSIRMAIEHLFSSEFQDKLYSVVNPYGNGGASEAIVQNLENLSLNNLLKKSFFNLEGS